MTCRDKALNMSLGNLCTAWQIAPRLVFCVIVNYDPLVFVIDNSLSGKEVIKAVASCVGFDIIDTPAGPAVVLASKIEFCPRSIDSLSPLHVDIVAGVDAVVHVIISIWRRPLIQRNPVGNTNYRWITEVAGAASYPGPSLTSSKL